MVREMVSGSAFQASTWCYALQNSKHTIKRRPDRWFPEQTAAP